jgi:hypothetical protein
MCVYVCVCVCMSVSVCVSADEHHEVIKMLLCCYVVMLLCCCYIGVYSVCCIFNLSVSPSHSLTFSPSRLLAFSPSLSPLQILRDIGWTPEEYMQGMKELSAAGPDQQYLVLLKVNIPPYFTYLLQHSTYCLYHYHYHYSLYRHHLERAGQRLRERAATVYGGTRQAQALSATHRHHSRRASTLSE